MKLCLVMLIVLQAFVFAETGKLSASEIQQLKEGKQVVKTVELKGMKWPKVILYQAIKATPLESLAVFYAIDHQKNYVPNLAKSEVIIQKNPLHTEVSYIMEMPWPISDSVYIHSHQLSRPKDGYLVTWKMIKSNSTEKVEGSAHFSNFESGTLMKYQALVEPKSFIASFLKSTMIKDVKKSMELTRQEVIKIKKSNRKLMGEFVKRIDDALSGKFTYIKP
jgi:hypothetical protein